MGHVVADLHYLSERLARDLVTERDALDATEPPVEREAGFEPVTEGELGPLIPDNDYLLAEHAEQSARRSGETGGLEDASRYLLLRNAPVRLWVFRPKGGGIAPFAFATVREKRAMAVLLGSPGNVRGWEAVKDIDGWVPSHVAGLRDIVRKLARPGKEAELEEMDFSQTAEDAANIAVDLTQTPDLSGSFDVLARIYHHESNLTLGSLTSGIPQRFEFDTVSVGAPIVIREPGESVGG